MHDLRHLINIVNEARSHPELNPKHLTIDVINQLKQRPDADQLYVHFNNIEKVGLHLNSNNTFGPTGIYAFPLGFVDSRILEMSKMHNTKYMNVLKASSSLKLLNLNKVDQSFIQQFYDLVARAYKKALKSKTKDMMSGSIRNDWSTIAYMIADIARKRKKPPQHLWNVFLRQLGYDAVYDSSRLMNDNPNQMIFLVPGTYQVVLTEVIRF
jgi:hypothetical protein